MPTSDDAPTTGGWRQGQLIEIKDREFAAEAVEMDGYHFTRCTFVGCEVRFRGEQPFSFTETYFDECRWVFLDRARMVIYILGGLFHLSDDPMNVIRMIQELITDRPPPN